jgi:uncharacterized protein DUF4160
MPKVKTIGPYDFFFYSNDHEPPHIHVREGSDEATFSLSPDVSLVVNRGFASHKLTRIQSLVKDHRAEFARRWYEHLGGR